MKKELELIISSTIFPALLLLIFLFAIALLVISGNLKARRKRAWGSTKLIDYEDYHFFLDKASAYRRIFMYFTFLSYLIKAFGVLTTFFIIYSLVDNSFYSKVLLLLSALFDSVSMLFPFQKYIDLFSKCCISMEEAVFLNDIKLKDEAKTDKKALEIEVHEDLVKKYIECEKLLHVENKI